MGLSRCEFKSLRKRSQTSFVNSCLNVSVSDALQVDHRGRDIAMSHPLLQGTNVDSVLQVPRRVCVAKLMKKPSAAEGPLSTAIDGDRSVLQFVSNDTVTTIEFGSMGECL